MGSKDYDDVGLRQAVDNGFVEGPRIVTATYAIGSTGGHCDSTFFPPSMGVSVRSRAPLLHGSFRPAEPQST